MHSRLTITNILLFVGFLITLITLLYPELYVFGINDIYIGEHNYFSIGLQLLFYSFIHNSLLTFVTNFLFVYYFGNEVETMLGDKKFSLFYFFGTLIIGGAIFLWGSENTVGMNGISAGLIAYYTYELFKRGNSNYRSGLTALAVNIVLGMIPGISMIAIVVGGIYGGIFFQVNKKLLK